MSTELLDLDCQGRKHGPRWAGGRTLHAAGYVWIHVPGHPRAGSNDYVLEHLLVAERALGKPLPAGAVVHHVDGDRANNAASNLVICQNSNYHNLLHRRQRAYDACGRAGAYRFRHCGGYEGDVRVYQRRAGGYAALHLQCQQALRAQRKALNVG